MLFCHPGRGVLSVLILCLATSPVPAAELAMPDSRSKALEVLADLTLIDGACRDMTVNFGVGFRFAAEQGVSDNSVLPGGAARPAFERVLRMRQASFGPDELCGEIAENYAEALPGSIVASTRRRGGP